MATSKNRNTDDQGTGKVRIRVMEVEIEGSNETIMDGIRQITSTLPGKVVTRVAAPAPKALTNGTAPAPSESHGDPEHAPDETAGQSEDESAAAEEAPAATPKRPRAQRSAPKAPPLADYLRPHEDPTLSAFIEQTTLNAESSIMDQAIGIAMWIKEQRQRDSINGSELCTCCKFLGWSAPLQDPTSPMRNLKRDEDQRMNSVKGKPGTFTLSGLGEQHFAKLKKK